MTFCVFRVIFMKRTRSTHKGANTCLFSTTQLPEKVQQNPPSEIRFKPIANNRVSFGKACFYQSKAQFRSLTRDRFTQVHQFKSSILTYCELCVFQN